MYPIPIVILGTWSKA